MQIIAKTKLYSKEYTINFDLRTRITVIADLSGVGKTLVRKLVANNYDNIAGYGSEDIGVLRREFSVEEAKFPFTNKLIILDDFEVLVREIPDLVYAVNGDRDNYYLIYTRKNSDGIKVTPNGMASLAFNSDTNTFSIKYKYSKGKWA